MLQKELWASLTIIGVKIIDTITFIIILLIIVKNNYYFLGRLKLHWEIK